MVFNPSLPPLSLMRINIRSVSHCTILPNWFFRPKAMTGICVPKADRAKADLMKSRLFMIIETQVRA